MQSSKIATLASFDIELLRSISVEAILQDTFLISDLIAKFDINCVIEQLQKGSLRHIWSAEKISDFILLNYEPTIIHKNAEYLKDVNFIVTAIKENPEIVLEINAEDYSKVNFFKIMYTVAENSPGYMSLLPYKEF